jgi:hypothetical protein
VLAVAAVWPATAAEPRWIKAKLGAFEAISDDGRKPAIQALSQFAQFSFALGTVMGQPDLKLEPPLRIIVFRNAQELNAQCAPPLRQGRDRLMACTTAEGQLPASLVRELTRTLLHNNFGNMPPGIELAMETFFSTVQSNAVHVTWGTPPPVAERSRDWALLHRIITQPNLSGSAKIYLHNLAAGMDPHLASRNAFGEDAAKFDAETDQYYAAGVFSASAAPSRPLNPERDVFSTALTSDEGDLMRADLLGPSSAALYQSLLKAGKQTTEANEGLALLALHANDAAGAKPYIDAALKGGSKNPVSLTEFARVEKDPARATEILRQALTADAKYADAHWVFGEKLTDLPRRFAEWKQAVNLAPRNYEWWAKYAQLSMDLQQYAEAGRAWVAAAQAAPTPDLREQYLNARAAIETQRLEAEDAERRKETQAKAQEIDRLKAQARKDLADLEARANQNPLSKEEVAKAASWFDANAAATVDGTLIRIDCTGKQRKLTVKDEAGKSVTLLIADASQFLVQGGDSTFACGAQKPRQVTVAYRPGTNLGKGISGEATGLEFK